jgi:hypothetical protein
MIVSLTNGTIVPMHWNDRFYEADCPECGEEVWASTNSEMRDVLDIHC